MFDFLLCYRGGCIVLECKGEAGKATPMLQPVKLMKFVHVFRVKRIVAAKDEALAKHA